VCFKKLINAELTVRECSMHKALLIIFWEVLKNSVLSHFFDIKPSVHVGIPIGKNYLCPAFVNIVAAKKGGMKEYLKQRTEMSIYLYVSKDHPYKDKWSGPLHIANNSNLNLQNWIRF
jgi:hypothetical protein